MASYETINEWDNPKEEDGQEEVLKVVPTFQSGFKHLLLDSYLNILLIFVPLSFISNNFGCGETLTFFFAILSLAPLAERLGFVTEQLAIHTNETIGGLLNATFGNATELLVAIIAIFKGLYRLVQLSLLGSILSNLLLVLGTSFFVGGLKYKTQYFKRLSSQVNSTLLMLSTMVILVPGMLLASQSVSVSRELMFSRVTSVMMLLLYLAYILFQLVTHRSQYDSKLTVMDDLESIAPLTDDGGVEVDGSLRNGKPNSYFTFTSPKQKLQSLKCSTDTNNVITFEEKSDGSEEDEEVILGFHWSLFWLAVIAVIVAYESELVADTIEQASINAGISPMFMAAILLPIVGNAAEHAGSIMFAYHNKLELTLGVAVGSSTQIALFVLPFSVVLGWISEHDMGLEFTEYDASTLLIAVISVTFAIKDGSSNWLVGLILICEYVVVSIGYFTLHATSLKSSSIDPALSSPI